MKILSIVIIFIVVSAFTNYLYKTSKMEPPVRKEGYILLKINNIYKILALVFICFLLLILTIALIYISSDSQSIMVVAVFVLFFLAIFTLLFIFSVNVQVEVTEEMIIYHNMFKKTTELKWSAIDEVLFSYISQGLVLKSSDKKIKLNSDLVGFKSFIQVMKSKLNRSIYEKALERIPKYTRNSYDIQKREHSIDEPPKTSEEVLLNSMRSSLDAEINQLEKKIKNGASWFYWISGLSIINTLVYFFDEHYNFICGLGTTQIIDNITNIIYQAYENNSILIFGLIVSIVISSIFIIFGFMATKKRNSAFLVGMALYSVDAIIFISSKDFVATGFHIFALYWIFIGFTANRDLKELLKEKI